MTKNDIKNGGEYPVYQNSLSPMGYYHEYNVSENTTYVISAGAAGEIGFCADKFWAADDCLVISNAAGFTNKYIYYCLLSQQDYIKANVRRASIPRLSREVIEKIKVPVISLYEQERIVTILDKLNIIYNNLYKRLLEEIEAQNKQYEYYRNELLAFKEKT